MSRRGFSLLEVMVALSILVVSLALLVETQSNAALMTYEAERVIAATDLATAKLNEARMMVEEDGFQVSDIEESGDFSDFGDGSTQLDFEDSLDAFQWSYSIAEIDLALAGDIASMMSEFGDNGVMDAFGGEGGGLDELGGGGGDPLSQFASLGMSSDMLTEMLAPFIREVRVVVWWGDSMDEAEERGDQVVVTGHVINPTGVVALEQSMDVGK